MTPAAASRESSVRWLGHGTVLVDTAGVRVLTDPLLRTRLAHLRRLAPLDVAAVARVDAALVSHVHYDHLDLPSLERLDPETAIVVPAGAGRLLRRRRFRSVVELQEGEVAVVRGLEVRATHAKHTAARIPGISRPVPALGYLLDGGRIYFAGDTDVFESMADISDALAVALLPIAGWGARLPPGHLDPCRAAQALRLLRPRVAVPIHWGTYRPFYERGHDGRRPAEEFVRHAAELAPEVEVRVLAVGEELRLHADGRRPFPAASPTIAGGRGDPNERLEERG